MAPSWTPRRISGRSWAIFAVLACPRTPWGGIWDPKTTPNGANVAPKVEEKLDTMSDSEVEAMLSQMLDGEKEDR